MSPRSAVLSIAAIAAAVLVLFALSRESPAPKEPMPAASPPSLLPQSSRTVPLSKDETARSTEGSGAGEVAVEPPDHSPSRATSAPGRDADSRARLEESAGRAALEAQLFDAGGQPVAAARVRLVVDPDETIARRRRALAGIDESEMQQWTAETDAQGTCVLRNLPADLGLRPRITRDMRAPAIELDSFVLQRGEVRRVEWRLNDGYEVSGVVLDQGERPVAGLEILVQRPAAGLTPDYQIYDASEVIARARTDGAGRFRLRAVPAGTWWLGPEPPGGPNQAHREVAALAIVVEVPARSSTSDIVLHVERGLSIRGRVLDPNGASAGRQWVTALEEGFQVPVAVMSAADGSFAVGPLRPGRCELYAGGGSNEPASEFLAPSRPVSARAGDENVVLELELGGSIQGQVVDRRTGAGVQAVIWLSARSPTSFGLVQGSSAPDSSFEFEHLNAETYDIGVQSGAGLCGVAKNIVVEANQRTKKVTIALDPSAMLFVRYDGTPARASLGVVLDGVHMPGGGVLVRGTTMNLPVPAGRSILEVHLLGKGKMPDRTIDIAAGEVRNLVISDED